MTAPVSYESPLAPLTCIAVADPRSNALFECSLQLEQENSVLRERNRLLCESLRSAIYGTRMLKGFKQWAEHAQLLIDTNEEL